jgi:hypothetical protein
MALGVLLAVALMALLAAGPTVPRAGADAYLGSTLLLHRAPDTPEPEAIDSLFYLTSLASDTLGLRRYLVTTPGQIEQFQLRGYTAGSTPAPIHFQVLRRTGKGALQIVASSAAFSLPTVDGVWSFDPQNFCVRPGDYLAFNEEGGPVVNVFASVPGSTTQRFAKNNGTMNGDRITPTALPNVELLMSAYEGTGPNASPLCGGIAGIELHVTSHSIPVGGSGAAALPLACTGPLPCAGSLDVTATERRNGGFDTLAVGHAAFSLPSHGSGDVNVAIGAAGRRLLRSDHGSLFVTIASHLGAGGPDDTLSSTATLTG